jgi:hypothetical protein
MVSLVLPLKAFQNSPDNATAIRLRGAGDNHATTVDFFGPRITCGIAKLGDVQNPRVGVCRRGSSLSPMLEVPTLPSQTMATTYSEVVVTAFFSTVNSGSNHF